jgi:Spy/CpxP family protein refolding chaperone
MTRSFLLALPVALAIATPSLGCSGSVGSEPTTTTISPDTAAAAAATRAPLATPLHGPLKVMADALADVPLTATQRPVVEKLAADTATRHTASRAAHRDLMIAIAAQVQAGTIDRTALQPKIDALVTALQAAQPADRSSFEQLHALLTPDQRTAFVNAMEAHVADRVSTAHDKHPLQQWAVDLQLTDDQKAQIRAAMKEHWQEAAHDGNGAPGAEHRQQAKAMLTAFAQDRFVMDEVSPAKDVAGRAQRMTARMLGIAEAALPVLTPQQRALAAQKLRDKAETLEAESPGLE